MLCAYGKTYHVRQRAKIDAYKIKMHRNDHSNIHMVQCIYICSLSVLTYNHTTRFHFVVVGRRIL